MVKITKNFVPESKWRIKASYPMTPKFIVVHNTANDASAASEVAYMTRNDNWTSFHYAVDDKEAVQAIPHTRSSWSCGDGSDGKGNRNGISVEVCYSKSGGVRFDKAVDNAVDLIAQVLKSYGWGVDKVKKHQDFSGKYCPHRILDMGWGNFLARVEKGLLAKEEDYMKQFSKNFIVDGDYCIDTLPWTCTDHVNIGRTSDYVGRAVVATRYWEGYYYVPELKGWIDHRGLKAY